MSQSKISEYISLIGNSLAVFGFVFGLWSGVLSGLDLIIDIIRSFSQPAMTGDLYYSESILYILLFISVCLVGQVTFLVVKILTKNGNWAVASSFMALGGLVVLIMLLIEFKAMTMGPILTAMGELMVLGSSLMMVNREIRHQFLNRNKAVMLQEDNWSAILQEARENNLPLSILSLATSKTLHAFHLDKLIDELRADDLVLPVKDGAFILLWKTDCKTAVNVAHHIQNFLKENSQIETRIGIADFPANGTNIRLLISNAEKALSRASTENDNSIICSSMNSQ